jgi:hypothetical protein
MNMGGSKSIGNNEVSIQAPIVCDSEPEATFQKSGYSDRMKACWNRCIGGIGKAIWHPRGGVVIVGGIWTVLFGVLALTASDEAAKTTHGTLSVLTGIVTATVGISNVYV